MASCLVPDFPAVLVALEHLKELDRDLAEDGARFGPEARPHLAQIAAAVSELEAERRAAHEQLEVESIENSELRHKIQNVSETMREDIQAEVAAALTSITEEIDRLREDLRASSQLIEEAALKQQELLEQNEALRPERDKLTAEHDALLSRLDEEAALKCRLQKRLDETREQTEKMRSHIADLQRERLTLQDNLLLEREAFSKKNEELCREEDHTEERIKQQKEDIKRRSEELEAAKKKKEETAACLQELANHTSRLESDLQTLAASRRQCEKQLEAEVQKRQELIERGEMLKTKPGELDEAFRLTVQSLQEETETVEGRIEEARASGRRLQEKLAAAREVYKRRQAEETRVRAEHSQVSQQLERSRTRLDEHIAAIVRYNQEVREMDKQVRELRDATAISKRMFQRNQEELCENIRTERRNLTLLEEEKNRLTHLLDELTRKQEEDVAKMESDIADTRRRCEELRREEAALQQREPENADADSLRRHIAETEMKYKEMEKLQREETEKCSAEAEVLLRSNEEKQRDVEEKEQLLKEVENRYSEQRRRQEGLTALHRELLGLRAQLETSVGGLEEERRALLRQKEELKAELEEAQRRRVLLLDKHNSELRAAEVSIYNNTVKLERVRLENSRLHLAVARMTEDVGRARRDRERYRRESRRLARRAEAQREALREAWRVDGLLTRSRRAKHAALLDSIQDLVGRLEARRRQVGHLSSVLHTHMLDFSRRLGDKAALEEDR